MPRNHAIQKTVRFSVNVPPPLVQPLRKRVASLPYRSISDFFVAMILMELLVQPAHDWASGVLNNVGAERDRELDKIAGVLNADGGSPLAAVPSLQSQLSAAITRVLSNQTDLIKSSAAAPIL